jgi:outer membrane protein insertion porin family/translocation and assembly module TamA
MNWQANLPFTYQGNSDVDGLDTVMVTYPELITNLDVRDDPLQPKNGVFFTNSLQFAMPIRKNDPTDVRIRPDIRTYVPLDRGHRLILATRFGVGMVFPIQESYGKALLDANAAAGQEGGVPIDYSEPGIVADQHKLLFRAFYSGGSNSNRGYPSQRIGPQGPIGFLLPENETCQPQAPDQPGGEPIPPPPTCIRPLGGFSLWETSLELRYQASENWVFVGFVDASDVSARIAHFSLAEPHVTVGPGFRYLSPVGPVRFDVGYRLPGLQKLRAVNDEPPDISQVTPYYQPSRGGDWDNQAWFERFTLHILIGEAF